MLQSTDMNSTDLCATLFFRLVKKGYSVNEVEKLVKDTYSIVKNGGFFTLETINETLGALGWNQEAMDSYSLDLIFNLLKKAFNLESVSHSIN